MTQAFVVEAKASSIVFVAVLSQMHEPRQILSPITYYSRKLIPAEQNFKILDKEHFAIKTTSGEWRYHLKGTCHLVQMLINHKNQEYLCRAKALHQQLLQWALFFSRFNFYLLLQPWSQE